MTVDSQSKSSRSQGDGDRDSDTLATRAHDAADGARQATLDRVESVRASTQAAKERAAESVRKFGSTVRKIGEHLRVEDQDYIADKATDMSQRLESVATYLSSAELATLATDARKIARTNPTWFYGGAFIVGLAAGRFFKGAGASTGSRNQDSKPSDRNRRNKSPESSPASSARADSRERTGSQSTSGPRTNERARAGSHR